MKLWNRRSSIRARLGRLLVLAAVVAGLCFLGLDLAGRSLMDRFLTGEDFIRRQDQRYLDSLRDYIEAESVTAWDADKLTQWVYEQNVVSIQVVRNGMVTYDSFYPEADFNAYPSMGQYYEWGDYHDMTFADGPATVWLYGYYYYQYDVRLLVLSLAGAFLVFLGVVMTGLQGTITYIRQLSQEIGVLEGGALDVPITVRGRDELTDLAQGLDAMRDSFRRQGERERQLVQANQRMITEMSHDLRTPLTAILLYVELLRRNGGEAEKREEYLDRLEGKVEQMRTLADHLFRYALSSGAAPAGNTEAVTLEAGVGDALSELAACLTERGFRVEAHLPWSDRQVAMDCEGAARVLDNLTSNLLKYADPHTPVTIALLDREKGWAGVQIANALRPSADGAESSGVGLASASRLMEQMGGRLDRGETDGGFQVTLLFRYVQT